MPTPDSSLFPKAPARTQDGSVVQVPVHPTINEDSFREVAKGNRERFIQRLKADLHVAEGLLYIVGGKVAYRYNTDGEQPFRQESNFFYLTGVNLPDFSLLIHFSDHHSKGHAILLAPKYDVDHTLWSGDNPPNEVLKVTYGVDDVVYDTEFPTLALSLLESKTRTSTNPLKLFVPSYHPIPLTFPTSLTPYVSDPPTSETVTLSLSTTRLYKSPLEISLIRTANMLSGEAHRALMRTVAIKGAVTEHELYALFVYETAKRGAAFQAYMPIVGGGCHGATLHYIRNRGPLPADPRDLVLVDAGCEYFCYASDITRTWPVGGKFLDEWKDIYEIVLEANKTVISTMKPGTAWEDMHLLADRVIAKGLLRLGILKGDLEEILEKRVQAVFFPHGLGHLMGLDVHDPAGYPPGTPRIPLPGLRYLRLRRPLAPGMVVTVEPGIYFVDGLIDPALQDPALAKYFDPVVLSRYRAKVGGVRIEDDIAVTENGVEDLTGPYVGKEIKEIESYMQGE
ncbi:hypothetical protein HDU93_001738 [Gonapodya sp. JEL0774]|nr:hypothetical protein HDU93_001738 [Gonapodya sp. JEL0774]